MNDAKREPIESGITLAFAGFVAQVCVWGAALLAPLSFYLAIASAAQTDADPTFGFCGGVVRVFFLASISLAAIRTFERICERWPIERP